MTVKNSVGAKMSLRMCIILLVCIIIYVLMCFFSCIRLGVNRLYWKSILLALTEPTTRAEKKNPITDVSHPHL